VDFIFNAANLPRQNLIVGAGLRESPSRVEQTRATVNFTPNQINNYVYTLFAQDSVQLIANRLMFTAGTKLEDNNYSGWGVQPSARLLWTPAAHTTLWGAVSRALRTPGRVDRDLSLIGYAPGFTPPLFVQVSGNPAFQPEVMIGWEAGYRQLIARKLYVDVAGFHNQYDNVESYGAPSIGVETNPYTYLLIGERFANGLRGVTNGIEIAPDWKPRDWMELRGSYSYLHMALHSKAGFSQATYAANDVGSSPAHEASMQAILALPHRVEVVPDVRYVSSLPALTVPGYETADVHVSYALAEHLQVSLDGRNLLQPHHPEFAGNDSNATQIRRSLNGGVIWSW
jgi:iron complex outermembrane receptor protein